MDIDSRALELIQNWNRAGYTNEGQKANSLQVRIIAALKEQDKITRHACAEAVIQCPEDVSGECVWKNDVHSACMNVDAINGL